MNERANRALSAAVSWWRRDDGATMVEYGLLLAGIVLVAVVAVALLGARVTDFYESFLTVWP